MTKAQLKAAISERLDAPKAVVQEFLDALQTETIRSLESDGEATIPGIAKLSIKRRSARPSRMGVNPATGEPMRISAKPASEIVRAKPLSPIKEIVG